MSVEMDVFDKALKVAKIWNKIEVDEDLSQYLSGDLIEALDDLKDFLELDLD